jgi:hypothetical protein
MEWEKPESVEISLACEISGYANAEFIDFARASTSEEPGCGALLSESRGFARR